MRLKITTLVLGILAINLFAQNTDSPITLETETGKIEGSLLSPAVTDKLPVVLIIAGSGPTDRNGNNPFMANNSLKMVAEGLAGMGIASVRYDKRGIGESKNAGLQESDLRFEHYVEDAKAWTKLLKSDPRFSEVIILGHSEGSLIGMIAAQQVAVSKFISLAGSGVPAADILREQLKSQPPAILDQALPIIKKLENGEKQDSVPPMFFALFRPSVQPYMISWFKYDPQKEIARLNIPVLIIQGTTDIQVTVSDAEKLAKANTQAQIRIIEEMNHILKNADADRMKNLQTYGNPELPLKEGLMEVIGGFINR